MKINKEIISEIISLCEIMSEGRANGTINQITYSEKFKPFLTKFKDRFGESPNLFLQNELKSFYDSNLQNQDAKLKYKSFGFWGRSVYNYTWTCIYYDLNKEAIPASYSPQLYIVVNKYGIKFGFCYGNYVEDNNEMVTSALQGLKFTLLKKCFENDKDLKFFNSSEEEITASPEKLFDTDENILFKTDNEIINEWTSRSLLIKEYPKNDIPDNIEFIIKSTLVNLSDFFISLLPIRKMSLENHVSSKPFSLFELISQINSSGLHITEKLITRFIASLLTKPFVILTGLSGSGKTKLAQAFALWICEDDSQYCIVPVGADWTNREPLLGFPNALEKGNYIKPDNRVLDLIIEANINESKPYFLILDEMNLSHVERYFADFLSVMESKNKIALHPGDADWNDVPAQIGFPKNLFIIGTVNIDETTYMFSPKVLDRASVIEFRVSATEMNDFLQSNSDIRLENLEGAGKDMAESFVLLSQDKSLEGTDEEGLNNTLMNFFVELKKSGAEFGYRSASEIIRFAAVVNKLDPEWTEPDITDAAIMQKLLPKVHGSRRKLEAVLKTLGGFCLEAGQNFEDYISKSEIDFADRKKIKYPVSLEKILRMYSSLISNGFTSYAEA